MSARAEGHATAKGLVDCGGVFLGEESGGFEFVGVRAPVVGVEVHYCEGHLDEGAFLEEVLVVEEGVFADIAGAGAFGVETEEFLECGVEERAFLSHGEDFDGFGVFV